MLLAPHWAYHVVDLFGGLLQVFEDIRSAVGGVLAAAGGNAILLEIAGVPPVCVVSYATAFQLCR